MEYKDLGQKIRDAREDKDIKQKDLAEYLQIEKNTMSQYEKLSRTPDYHVLKKISEKLNVSADYLIGNTNRMIPRITEEYAYLISKYENASENIKTEIHSLLEKEIL